MTLLYDLRLYDGTGEMRQGTSRWGPQSTVPAQDSVPSPTPPLCQPCVGAESVNARLVHARRVLPCCATFQHSFPLFGDRVSLCNSDRRGTSCGPGLNSKFSCLSIPSMYHNTQLSLEWRYKVRTVSKTFLPCSLDEGHWHRDTQE